MSAPTETFHLDLGGDRVAEIVIRVIEAPLPTPLERSTVRKPTLREMDEVAAALSRRAWFFPAAP